MKHKKPVYRHVETWHVLSEKHGGPGAEYFKAIAKNPGSPGSLPARTHGTIGHSHYLGHTALYVQAETSAALRKAKSIMKREYGF